MTPTKRTPSFLLEFFVCILILVATVGVLNTLRLAANRYNKEPQTVTEQFKDFEPTPPKVFLGHETGGSYEEGSVH